MGNTGQDPQDLTGLVNSRVLKLLCTPPPLPLGWGQWGWGAKVWLEHNWEMDYTQVNGANKEIHGRCGEPSFSLLQNVVRDEQSGK